MTLTTKHGSVPSGDGGQVFRDPAGIFRDVLGTRECCGATDRAGRFVLSVGFPHHDVPVVDSPGEPSIRVRCLRARVRLAVSSAGFPVPSRVFYFERKVPMEKQWPDGPMPGPVPSRLRYSTEVRVTLAAAADGLGEMVWIAVWQGSDGSSVRGDQMNEQGLIAAAMPGFDGRSGDDLKAGCQRGGFGRTGGQFYKPEEGA